MGTPTLMVGLNCVVLFNKNFSQDTLDSWVI